MPSTTQRTPKYRHYKPKDLAVVRLDGRDIYLGKYGTPESWEKYHRLVAEWIAGGRKVVPVTEPEPVKITVNQVLLQYMRFAHSYYVSDGETTSEVDNIAYSLRTVRKLYGRSPADEFGPKRLKIVRTYMIEEDDLCRNEINKRIGRIKRAFKWAVSEELIPPSISHGHQAVAGLRKGRTKARESAKVKPVDDQHVRAVLPYLPPQVTAMVMLQRLTGMRPGEVVILRPCDVNMDDDVWIYDVPKHKNDWRDYDRVVAIGRQGQDMLGPYLDRESDTYCFSPREAFEWRLENRLICYKKERKTPVYPSELRARERRRKQRQRQKSGRRIGKRYTTDTYWQALDYAFKKAKGEGKDLERWFPNQLRHSRGTELRKRFGVEGSRVSLGHAHLTSTEIYAERDISLAIKIAREFG